MKHVIMLTNYNMAFSEGSFTDFGVIKAIFRVSKRATSQITRFNFINYFLKKIWAQLNLIIHFRIETDKINISIIMKKNDVYTQTQIKFL